MASMTGTVSHSGTTRGRPLRVLLVDDDPLVRAGLRTILSSASDLDVVAEAADGAAAITAVRAHRVDVALMDVRMPGVDGITATKDITALPDPPKVIVLTTFHLDEYVFGALRAGASGFLLKDTPPADIVGAVRLVAAGDAMLSPSVTRTLIDHYSADTTQARRTAAEKTLKLLTEREREVAAAVGRGQSNADIAAGLYMSEATVKAHVSRILTKLNAANRVQLAITMHDAGLA
jgi:DNA-binding NarL/FixJ family response regulator